MRHPVLPGVAEHGEKLQARATGELLELGGAEAFDLLAAAPAASADTIVFTHALCSVPNVPATLAEADRVLKPGGQLLVLEHVRVPGLLGRVQDGWSPIWQRVPGGRCHPNRELIGDLRAAGFAVIDCDRFSTRGIPILSRYVALVAIRKAQAPTKEDGEA